MKQLGADESPAAFLTMEEVLGYLKVTSRTVYRLIKVGDLPAVRLGRQWRFRRTDLDAWLNRQQTNFDGRTDRTTARGTCGGYQDETTVPTSAMRKVS